MDDQTGMDKDNCQVVTNGDVGGHRKTARISSKCGRDRGNCGGELCYAWVVGLSTFIMSIITYGVSWTSGIFYDLFSDEFNAGSGLTALMTSLNTAVLYGAGPITGALTNRFGHRVVAVLGGVLSLLGLTLSAFGTSVYFLMITYGVVTGAGFNMCYIPSMSMIALHMSGRGSRLMGLAYGVATTGVGVGAFCYPVLLRVMIDAYGWRGALLLTAGIAANLCAAGALLRPPKSNDERPKKRSDDQLPVVAPETSPTSPKLDADQDQAHLQQALLTPERNTTNPESNKRTTFRDSLRLDVFRSRLFVNLCVSNMLICFGLSVVYGHLYSFAVGRQPGTTTGEVDDDTGEPLTVTAVYADHDSAALLMSTLGVTNLVGRIFFGLLASANPSGVPCHFGSALLVAGICTLLSPLLAVSGHFVGLMIFASVFGVSCSCIGPLLPLTIIQFLDVESLASGTGYVLLFEATGQLLGAPAAGWLYDAVGEYAASFYMAGASLAVSGLMLLIPWIWQFCRSSTTSHTVQRTVIVEPNSFNGTTKLSTDVHCDS